MNIKEIITRFKNRYVKRDIKELAEQGAEIVQATLEEFKKEDDIDEVKRATEAAIEELKKYPKRELAVEMIGNINEISPEVAANAVIQMTEEAEFSEKTAINAATSNDFADQHIITIIEESSIGYEGKTAIAETLKDEETRDEIQQQLDNEEEQRCLKQLHKIYLLCNEDINELKLEKQLNEVMENMHIHTDAIQEKINRIIARLIALNFARYGSNIISKQTSLMPASKMREVNIVEIAQEEYQKLLKEYETINGKKIKPFNSNQLINSISIEIEAAAKTDGFDEKGAFNNMMHLLKTLLRYDERKKWLIETQSEIANREKRETISSIRELGLIEKLAELPEEEREKVLKTLGNVLDNRKNRKEQLKVARTTPKIKSDDFTTKAKQSNKERE